MKQRWRHLIASALALALCLSAAACGKSDDTAGDDWRASGHCKDFLCFDKLDEYKDFGGIRLEDDILITADGCRFLGKDTIPIRPKDVEEFMAQARG